MSKYNDCKMCLTEKQIKKFHNAVKNKKRVDVRFNNKNLSGNMKLPLTATQMASVEKTLKNNKGVKLTFSVAQLKETEKRGGSLLALIPGLIGAAGGLAGGIASAVNSSKQTAEQARHNRAIEEKLGTGVMSDTAAHIPIIGKPLSVLL